MILVAESDEEDTTYETLTQLMLTEIPHNQTDPQFAPPKNPAQINLHALMGHSIPQDFDT